uniref:Secreted protein n=1 Tax=Taeniopygia guttata TaxID=59729 RepID=A0A674GZY1_TAEGU
SNCCYLQLLVVVLELVVLLLCCPCPAVQIPGVCLCGMGTCPSHGQYLCLLYPVRQDHGGSQGRREEAQGPKWSLWGAGGMNFYTSNCSICARGACAGEAAEEAEPPGNAPLG